ncbi:hypothetical protein D3C74_498630 [compost metagenome]
MTASVLDSACKIFSKGRARISSSAVAITITVRRPMRSLRMPDGIIVSAKPIFEITAISSA